MQKQLPEEITSHTTKGRPHNRGRLSFNPLFSHNFQHNPGTKPNNLLFHKTAIQITTNEPQSCVFYEGGKTFLYQIHPDAPVYVPDAEQLFLIPADSMALDDSCVQQVYQLMWPDDTLPRLETDDENVTYSIGGKRTFKGYGKHSATMGGWEGNEYRGVNYSHGLMPNMAGYYQVGLNTEWRIDDTVLYDSYGCRL